MQAGAAPLATAIAFYYGLAITLFLSVPHIALPSPLCHSLFLLHPFRPYLVMSFFLVADLQVETKKLARCLSSLHRFMTAAETLLNSIRGLSRYQFRQESAKIVTLIEIARATLLKMDIKLYTFSPCNSQLRPYKTIYLDILRALKERQNDISDSVRKGRIDTLLQPFSAWLVVSSSDNSSKASSPSASPPLSLRLSSLHKTIHHECPTRTKRSPPVSSDSSMPPPSKLPWQYESSSQSFTSANTTRLTGRGRKLERTKSFSYARTRSPPRQWRPMPCPDDLVEVAHDDDMESVPIPTFPVPPSRRNFGIFCTGLKSSYQRGERTGRNAGI